MTDEQLTRVKNGESVPAASIRTESEEAKAFFNQKVFFWKNEFFTRKDVIEILGNVLGGVHLETRVALEKPCK